MYAKEQGRFLATDPMAIKGAFLGNPQNLNRYPYTRNSPLVYVDSNGHCSVPAGLQKGQVGICIEAFIARPRLGTMGIGKGDGRGFTAHDGSKTARMRAILIVDPRAGEITGTTQVRDSEAGYGAFSTSDKARGKILVSGQTNANARSKSLGNTTVTVSFVDGANGFQNRGEDVRDNSRSPIGAAIGSAIVAMAPKGTIDGGATIEIAGSESNPVVNATSAEGRPFPSYAGYAYYYGADGKLVTQRLFEEFEGQPEELVEPVRKIPVTNDRIQ
jgi:hypothetical protein